MKTKHKISLFILFLLVVILIVWGYLQWNRSVKTDITQVEAITYIDTDSLIAYFQTNEEEANSALVEKVIEVKGVIKEISFLNNRHTIMLKSGHFSKNFIMCDMSPLGKQKLDYLTVGDTIKLKGVCKGYLLDVIMLNCMPVNEEPKN